MLGRRQALPVAVALIDGCTLKNYQGGTKTDNSSVKQFFQYNMYIVLSLHSQVVTSKLTIILCADSNCAMLLQSHDYFSSVYSFLTWWSNNEIKGIKWLLNCVLLLLDSTHILFR